MTTYDEEIVADENSTTNETNEWTVEHKPQSNIKKLLEQRNEARRELDKAKQDLNKMSKLEKQIADLTEMIAGKELEKDNEVYFTQNSHLKDYQNDILDVSREHNIPLDKASKLVLAEKNPTLLLDEQTRARKTDNQPLAKWVMGEVKEENPIDMDDDAFLAYTNQLAKNSPKFK